MPAPILQVKRGNAGVAGTVPALRPGEPAFSLNNFDFFVGFDTTVSGNKFFGSHRYWAREDATTSLRLKLVDRDGTNSIHLKAPNTLSGIGTYTLPDTNTITAGYFLKVGAGGTLSWDSVGSTSGTFTDPTLSGITTVSGTFFDVNTSADFSGITTFSNTTDSTTKDNGAVVVEGGVGIEKSVNIGGNLSVIGVSTFYGLVVENSGMNVSGYSTIFNLQITNNLGVGGYIDVDKHIDVGQGAIIAGIASFTGSTQSTTYQNGAVVIDGGVGVGKNVNIHGDLKVDGNVTIGGTFVSLKGQEVYIENKDIILGFTTSITPNDDTANHAGVAIASTEGTPLVSFAVSGINTLPDTYKQLMWFKSGTLGFSTDAFAFNYGLAIGTTSMADGVRLAVGSGITMTDDSISATNGYFTSISASNIIGSLTGTISTATRANTLDVIDTDAQTGNILFASSGNGVIVYNDTDLTYNSNTNTLSAPNIQSSAINAIDGASAITIANSTGDVGISSNLTVTGNLYVSGNTTQVNTTSLTVEDTLIELGIVNGSAPGSDLDKDLGLLLNYYSGTAKKAAVFWDDSASRIVFADDVTESSGVLTVATNAYASIEIEGLWVNDCAGQSQVISCTGSERFLENITVDAGTF